MNKIYTVRARPTLIVIFGQSSQGKFVTASTITDANFFEHKVQEISNINIFIEQIKQAIRIANYAT
ncbi:MAG: hypothetical protein E6R13_09315 [Spirochaetes bacterium]|nr:MAG: hypothetical protein E6R13_09315 [Spirochaetota bacterium]